MSLCWYEVRILDEVNYFLIWSPNNFIYLLLTRGRKNKWILIGILYWSSSSRLRTFVDHILADIKLDAQEKLFVVTTSHPSNVQISDFFQLVISTVQYYHCINFISIM